MIYREFKGLKLSQLGFGAMRLPVIDGDDAKVDVDQTRRMVDYAMEHGVNYYDTAWGYHGEHSESVMAEALGRYPRDSYFFADKFPGYDLANMPKVKEIFKTQMERTGLEYFDFYLLHNVCEMNIEQYLDPQYGIMDYLLEQKKAGRIRHFGFSCHGELPVMKQFLEAYGDEMEFCQLQLNYLDWTFQHGREKVELLAEYNIPVWVMEPLKVAEALAGEKSVPCTACHYCTDHCPQGLDIPHLIEMYNEHVLTTKAGLFGFIAPMALAAIPEDKRPAACLHCGSCEQVCPQQIKISDVMTDFVEKIG